MKKFLYLLLALPLLGVLASCSDDNNPPRVTINVDYEGATNVDGVLYVVQGEPFSITSVKAIPDQGTGDALVGPISYAWDYDYIGTAEIAPYGISFDTSVMLPGRHLLQLTGTVAQVDKSLASINIIYRIMVVESADQIPGNNDENQGGTIEKTVETAD